MDARSLITRGVSTGIRLGRGTADRVVTVAGPRLVRLTGLLNNRAIARLRRPAPSSTTTFTPSRQEPAPEAAPTVAERRGHGPSPASVARNIGPQRPMAKPARASKPKSVPGAKLPPRRAHTT